MRRLEENCKYLTQLLCKHEILFIDGGSFLFNLGVESKQMSFVLEAKVPPSGTYKENAIMSH